MALDVSQGTVLQLDTLWSSQGSAFSCGVGKAGRSARGQAAGEGKGSPLPGVSVVARLAVLFHCAWVMSLPASEKGEESRDHLSVSLSRENRIWPPAHRRRSASAPRRTECLGTWMHGWGSVQFSPSVMSNSLRPHELQHERPPCPSPTPRVYSNPCPSSR